MTYEPPAGWVDDPTDPVPGWMLDDPRTAKTAQFLATMHRATGARIRRAREARGLSREQLAEELSARGHTGWTVDAVTRLEAGQHIWKPIEAALFDIIDFSPTSERSDASLDAAIGANVRSVRMDAGITQSDLAARLTAIGTPWTASNVSLIEAGKRKVTLTALADLCRVFHLPATAFFGTEGFAPDVADRLRALGGTEEATSSADPHLVDDLEAADVARQRLAMRILGRIAARIPWDLAGPDATSSDRRVEVLDALEDLYGTRDILEVREQIATATAQGTGSGADPTPDEIADARSWATRQLDRAAHDVPVRTSDTD